MEHRGVTLNRPPIPPSAAPTLSVLLKETTALTQKTLQQEERILACANMASLKTILYLGVCFSAWIITTGGKNTR